MKATGQCQCGAKKFTVETDDYHAYYCHCRMCQRAVGNIFATFVNLPKNAVRWSGEEPDIYHSSKIAQRGYCATCGTPLTFAFPDSDRMDITVGSFDDPSLFTPQSHFGVESRIMSWHKPDGLPEKRTEDSEAVMERWRRAETL